MTTPAVPNPDGIMARLKAGTAAQHAVAESKPLEAALVEGSIGQAQYQKYLSQRWLIHRELEAATDRALKTDARLASLDLPSLYQTKNLESDLARLQSDLPSIQPLPGATHLIQEIRQATPSTLMGIYYVFEGSKNGARFIAKALAKARGFKRYDQFSLSRSAWRGTASALDEIPIRHGWDCLDAEREGFDGESCPSDL